MVVLCDLMLCDLAVKGVVLLLVCVAMRCVALRVPLDLLRTGVVGVTLVIVLTGCFAIRPSTVYVPAGCGKQRLLQSQQMAPSRSC
jgi:hypothetical protein